MRLAGLDWRVPDFSTVSRRQRDLQVQLPYQRRTMALDLLVDSTGIKFLGEGEWKRKKHGAEYRRQWRKVHLGIDAQTLEIRAIEVTDNGVGDAPMLPELLVQIPVGEAIASVSGDGAYDTRACHAAINARNAQAVIPPRSNGKPWKATEHGASARNEALRACRRLGWPIWGTGWAALQYARRVKLPSVRLMGAIVAAMLGGLLGAWLATLIPSARFRVALPWVLAAVWAYTLWRKDLGHHHAPHWSARTETLIATVIGGLIGFYDGVFGPGTGSFFVFALVRLLGWDFLHASAAAKRLNFATNVAALAWFIPHGHVVWALALPMAVANVAGSAVGTHLALKHGAGFVRVAFLLVVGALILKTGLDAWQLH